MEELVASPSHHTFRDPAGSVEVRPDGVYRHVNAVYAPDMLDFLGEPLAETLVATGRLISSTVICEVIRFETDLPENEPLLLHHPRVSFVSYPSEWSPALWLAAAELTLNLCRDLLHEGWILKDATPLNILFQGVQPIFVDVLSIQRADLTQPIWFAYGQFVRTFLLPMLAHARLGWPLQVALTRRDGFEPEEIYAALPWSQRLQQPALSSVTLPMLLAKRASKAAPAGTTASGTAVRPRLAQDPELTRQILLSTLTKLRAQMHRATPKHRASNWSDYVNSAGHYTEKDNAGKRDFVRTTLAACNPAHVLDVGCNTGAYSILAADTGAEVVSIDTDLQAIDRLCTILKDTGRNILPLCVDLSHPTPSTGWQNRENPSFLTRCTGHFDTVMMLAVLHHLLLNSQIPLEPIATLCSTLTTANLILEWVPPTDPMFRQLLRGRDALYAHLTEAAFREAFARHFTLVRESTLPNQRILFHFAKHNNSAKHPA